MKMSLFMIALLFQFQAILFTSLPAFSIDISKTIPHKSWEIKNKRGITVLPDMFYSDAEQNFQIMPVTLGNSTRPQIDHIIYPTLGNPSLFVQCRDNSKCTSASKNDEFMIVLRLEKEISDRVFVEDTKANILLIDPKYTKVNVKNTSSENILFELNNRHLSNSNPISIQPSSVLKLKDSYIPNELKKRDTLIFYFNQKALSSVSMGLYDISMKSTHLNPKKKKPVVKKETQYNALKIFHDEPNENYQIINVTDTQVSLGTDLNFDLKTRDRLHDFVNKVNALSDEAIAKKIDPAAFITFNGDLHNGGSPMALSPEQVAFTYQKEATEIFKILIELKTPIFLTPGNHDGYSSTGVAPSLINGVTSDESKITGIVKDLFDKNKLSNKQMQSYLTYLSKMESTPGGIHRDIFNGIYVRGDGPSNGQSIKDWYLVPEDQRNIMLYDGFNQWRKTYGPLYMAWSFNNNYFVNINSYDLRQHRRTGWGMYTVNYGGGISPFQMLWIKSEFNNAKTRHHNKDLILLSHHDPRGGHRGKDFPYMYKLVDYMGMSDSLFNFVDGEGIKPILCQRIPDSLKRNPLYLNCLHDGLQEWMRADAEFDCDENFKFKNMKNWEKTCNIELFKKDISEGVKLHPRYSGYELIHHIAEANQLETILLGHTHYHSFEQYNAGEALVNNNVLLDKDSLKNHFSDALKGEAANPIRFIDKDTVIENDGDVSKAVKAMESQLSKDNDFLVLNLRKAGHTFKSVLKEDKRQNRSLVIMRMTCESDLSDQKVNGKPMMGFSVFEVGPNNKNYKMQINKVTYYRNGNAHSNLGFEETDTNIDPSNLGYEKLKELIIDRNSTEEVREKNKKNFSAIINPEVIEPTN